MTFKKIRNADVKRKRTFVNKCEREIYRSALIKSVGFNRDLGLFRHLFNGKGTYVSHFVDSFRYFIKLVCFCLI